MLGRPTLVTGATGLLGHAIVRELAATGASVRVLVRSPERARAALPEGVELVVGDLLDPATLRAAVRGCELVYHAAGLPEQWLPDPTLFHRVNVEGVRHVLEAARAEGVRRLAHSSTVDVFASMPGVPFDESVLDERPKGTPYERSKQAADRLVTAAAADGLDAVILHPAALFGPGPTASPGVGRFLSDIVNRRVPMLLPGAMPLVLAQDAARGHLLAAERAAAGSRFILSDRSLTLVELARRAVAAAGRGRVPKVLPLAVARLVSAAGEAVARVVGRPPLIPRGQLHFLVSDQRPVSDRARRELGWTTTDLDEALRSTLGHLENGGRLG